MKNSDRAEVMKIAVTLAQSDPKRRAQINENNSVAKPIVDGLVALGYQIESLSDLVEQAKPWKTAMPLLLDWLPRLTNMDIKEAIVRCLSVLWLGNAEIAGGIRADLETAGKPIDAYCDRLIAGQAMRSKLTLTTTNISEFARVKELDWIKWGKPERRADGGASSSRKNALDWQKKFVAAARGW